MSDKADAIAQQTALDLMEHLRDFHKYGPSYVREYAEVLAGPKTTRRPPYRFHPKLAELVRELASEAAMLDRRPSGAAPSLKTRDGLALEPSRRKAA